MRILALDLGITSCGYCIVDEVGNNSYTLVDYGVVMRDNPYDKGTQKTRREHISSRKLIKKKKQRVKKIQSIFKKFDIKFEIGYNYNVWRLRAIDAFARRLKNDELFAILRYLSKHRGYRSLKLEDLIAEIEAQKKIGNCKETEIKKPNEKEFSQTLAYIDALKCKFEDKTVTQIIYDLEKDRKTPTFRNHDSYHYMIRREDIEDEIKSILKAQKKFGFFKEIDFEEFRNEVINTIIVQDSVELNEDNINNCIIYKDQKVAPIYSYSFDIFNLYKLVNNLKIEGADIQPEQKELILNYIYSNIKKLKNTPNLSVKKIKNILKIKDENIKINNTSEYRITKGKKEQNILIKFNFISIVAKLDRDILSSIFKENNYLEILDKLSYLLHIKINPVDLIESFDKVFIECGLSFSKEQIQNFAINLHKNKKSGTSNYSFKAFRNLIKYLKEGKDESEAKEILGVGKSEDYSMFPKAIKYLKPIDKKGTLRYELDENRISNHIIKSLVSWYGRVIIDLDSKFGKFDTIKVESTRELSLNDKVKNQIKSAQKKSEDIWQNLIKEHEKHLKSKGIENKNRSEYILKLKLWKEQKELGIYSHRPMGIDDILSPKTEIEHIVPRACGGTNAYYNKALDFKDENIKKGNRLPLNYLIKEQREIYIEFVKELKDKRKINFKKFKNLLAEELKDCYRDAKDEVSMHATSYAEKLLGEILKRYYPFADKEKRKHGTGVMSISGRATTYLRNILNIKSKSRDTNFHHLEDAFLLALMSRSYLQKISTNFEQNYKLTRERARENFKKIVPLIDGANPNEVIAHIKSSYDENIEQNPFYKTIFGILKTPYFWVDKKPISTKAHNETIQSKKDYSYYVPIHSLLEQVKPSCKMSCDEFVKKYNEKILEKLKVYKINPKDFISLAFIKKREVIVEILKKAIFTTSKDEEKKYNDMLRDEMKNPIYDVNKNIARRVKRVGEEANIPIRKGVAYTAKSLICVKFSYVSKDILNIQRVDLRNYKKDYTPSSINLFNNNLAEIYVIKSKKIMLKTIGIIKGFSTNQKGYSYINVRNPKYPLLKEKQPKKYFNQILISSVCGIKKYKIDASGVVFGFYYLGRILDGEKEFFSEVTAYRSV